MSCPYYLVLYFVCLTNSNGIWTYALLYVHKLHFYNQNYHLLSFLIYNVSECNIFVVELRVIHFCVSLMIQ
eukprot:UN03396